MSERIGLMVGWENTFPPAFIERVNKESGVTAEIAKIGGTNEVFDKKYSVIIDRISQEVEHYRLRQDSIKHPVELREDPPAYRTGGNP